MNKTRKNRARSRKKFEGTEYPRLLNVYNKQASTVKNIETQYFDIIEGEGNNFDDERLPRLDDEFKAQLQPLFELQEQMDWWRQERKRVC